MVNLEHLPLRRDGALRLVVETPAWSRLKLRYEPGDGAFAVSRPLPLGLHYPYDWGFFPSTLAEDGDPLDGMLLADGAAAPGVVVACRAVGVLRASQHEPGGARVRNDRLLAVAATSIRWRPLTDVGDLMKDE